ncbi:peroxiredoxin-like family protein [Coraliomargarita sp. SDUM461004]|uniref:thioredoxin-dependent peroxiredoxin n=1 Tax=Thalassobacterium sedimentorum TaxID=3041258 RepID=A0ABU1APZ8_9BACT|nr:peroxiredoxin-like family protein [Coraliomargarita sp. SDUM461004]MDQ8195831.1 peroxiredoxin-like family protein [Coraliomargarita sp. SDUM461004]
MLKQSICAYVYLLLTAFAPLLANAAPSDPRDVNPIEVGSALPEAQITNAQGTTVSIREIAGAQKSILIFYRGSWCPYCTKHLASIGQHEQAILKKGYQIIAISPDQPEATRNYIDKSDLNYSVYSDSTMAATKAFGLAFEWENQKSNRTELRPVPAVFITDAAGRIRFRHFDPNYRERLSPEALLKALD